MIYQPTMKSDTSLTTRKAGRRLGPVGVAALALAGVLLAPAPEVYA